MQRSETIKELAEALAKAQASIEGATRDTDNPFFKSKYADLGAVWDACRKPLSDNGLSIVQMPTSENGSILVETILMHSSGEWIADTLAVPVSKQDAQGYGSAITYARRYALMAAVGIAPEDDDGNGAVGGKSASKAAPEQSSGRKKSAAAKRDGDYEAIEAEIGQTSTPDELREWGVANKARIDALPRAFADPIRDVYANQMDALRARLGEMA